MVGKVREDGELEAGMSGSFVRAGLWRARLYTEKVRDACADCVCSRGMVCSCVCPCARAGVNAGVCSCSCMCACLC